MQLVLLTLSLWLSGAHANNRHPPGGHLLRSLAQLKKYTGFELNFAVDIGANRGLFTHSLKTFNPNAKILAVEGNSAQAEHLTKAFRAYSESGTVQFEISLLGNQTGLPVTFYVSQVPFAHTGNSIYRENTGYFRDSHKKLVKETRLLETLDDLLIRKGHTTCPDFVKIDTQGSELDILKGSPKTFACTPVVLFEMSLLRYNQNAPLAIDMMSYMHQLGYDLYDIVERHAIDMPGGDVIELQIDGLFVRKGIVDQVTKEVYGSNRRR